MIIWRAKPLFLRTEILRRLRFSQALAAFLCASETASAESLLPTKEGTTWEFAVSEQPGSGPVVSRVQVRIAGTEERGGKNLLRLETRSGDKLTSSELVAVDSAGVHRYERSFAESSAVIFNPPQTLLPAPLKVGAAWELEDRAAGTQMHQRFTVAAEEVVNVPAGTYHAFRCHCEQPWPISIAIDRWFAPGIGFVKDVTTTRGPTGRLMSRTTMALKTLTETAPPAPPATPVPQATAPQKLPPEPEVPAAATATPAEPETETASSETPRIRLQISDAREGESQTIFSSDAENIYVQWAGEAMPTDSTVRVAWIAEDVGDIAPANFVIDETSTTVTQPEFAARFTLSRPRDGWAAGKYRVELYLEDKLVQSLPVTIHD